MEILLVIVIAILAVALALATGAAMSYSGTIKLLRRWTVDAAHRERRLRRDLRTRDAKIDELTTELLRKNGIHLVNPMSHAATPPQNDDKNRTPARKIVGAAEVIAREKQKQAGAVNAPSQNGASVG